MVSERKKSIEKIDAIVCCDEIVKTSYCPHCGISKSKIYKQPQSFKVDFHTKKKKVFFENQMVFINTLGINEKITVEYKSEKNGDINLILLSDGIDQFRLVKVGSVDIHGNWL